MEKDNTEIEQNLKLLVKSSLIVFIGLFLSRILNYLYRIIIARNIGPEAFGLFTLAVTTLTLLIHVSSMGLTEGLVRYVAIYRGEKENDKIKYLFRLTLSRLIFSGILFGFLLFAFSSVIANGIFHNSELTFFLKIFSLIIPITIIYNIFCSMLRAFEKISIYSFIDSILQNLIKVIMLGFFIFMGLKINSIIFSYLLSISGVLLIVYFICKYQLKIIFQKPSLEEKDKKEIRKEFFSYSWPIMLYGISGTLFVTTDSFVIGYFNGPISVGFYSVAMSIATLLLFVPMLFTKLFFPLITKHYAKKDTIFVRDISKQVGKWIFLVNLPALLIMLFFPGTIINILFGVDYLISENALRFLAIGVFVLSICGSVSSDLVYMGGKSKMIFYNLIGVSIINLILNIVLIPKYDINGAAISNMISTSLLGLLLFFESYYYTSILPLKRSIIKIAVVSILPIGIMLVITKTFTPTIIGAIVLGLFFVLFYILLIFITHCLDKNDFLIINGIKSKLFSSMSLITHPFLKTAD